MINCALATVIARGPVRDRRNDIVVSKCEPPQDSRLPRRSTLLSKSGTPRNDGSYTFKYFLIAIILLAKPKTIPTANKIPQMPKILPSNQDNKLTPDKTAVKRGETTAKDGQKTKIVTTLPIKP